VKTGEQVRSFEGHDDKVTSVAYSPDGKSIISGSSDMTIKLWDVATGKLTRAFEGHTSSVQSIAFSRDGKTILSGSFDGTMKLWRVDRDESLATLIALDKDDWVVVSSEGMFDSSRGAEKLMHYVLDTPERGYEIIPLEQLKSRYYEPGLLQKLLKGER
jgi:WD40 repeat protein